MILSLFGQSRLVNHFKHQKVSKRTLNVIIFLQHFMITLMNLTHKNVKFVYLSKMMVCKFGEI